MGLLHKSASKCNLQLPLKPFKCRFEANLRLNYEQVCECDSVSDFSKAWCRSNIYFSFNQLCCTFPTVSLFDGHATKSNNGFILYKDHSAQRRYLSCNWNPDRINSYCHRIKPCSMYPESLVRSPPIDKLIKRPWVMLSRPDPIFQCCPEWPFASTSRSLHVTMIQKSRAQSASRDASLLRIMGDHGIV